MGTCLDQDQNMIDCADPNCTFGDCTDQSTSSGGSLLAAVQAAQVGTPTGPASPVASSAGGGGGTSILQSFLNFTSSVAAPVIGAATGSQASGLVLKTNPATGLNQYYNPTTGQFIGSPVSSTTSGLTSLFSGGGSLILVVVALVVAFFAFGFRKRSHA